MLTKESDPPGHAPPERVREGLLRQRFCLKQVVGFSKIKKPREEITHLPRGVLAYVERYTLGTSRPHATL